MNQKLHRQDHQCSTTLHPIREKMMNCANSSKNFKSKLKDSLAAIGLSLDLDLTRIGSVLKIANQTDGS